MPEIGLELSLFAAKLFIFFLFIVLVLITFFMLLAKGKEKAKDHIHVKNLNKKYEENKEILLSETLSKKQFKSFLKEQNKLAKQDKEDKRNVFVINFQGDIKASAVNSLREEVTTILSVATPRDEVVIRLESAGGVVHGYGLAAAQLMRFKAQNIPLTVCIDKIAASGGYLMACIANKILGAPFAIIGSIGVIVQLPNFHRLLKEKQIDFEQHTAGEFKRTITLFGENTEEGREKLQHEIEEIHQLFKNLIVNHRQQVDINRIATGEHWLGEQAITLKLIDLIQTSDDYLFKLSKTSNLFEISFEAKKTLLNKLGLIASKLHGL